MFSFLALLFQILWYLLIVAIIGLIVYLVTSMVTVYAGKSNPRI